MSVVGVPLALLRTWKCADLVALIGARARRTAAQPSTEVTAASNVVTTPGASSQLQASCALHY